MTDKQLINKYLAGDQNAFESLYQRYRKPIYAYLNSMLPGQAAVVDDLFQKTWIKAIRSLAKYREKQKFLAWIFRVAHNTAIDHWRHEKRYVEMEQENVVSIPDSDNPAVALARQELGAAINVALQKLPAPQREVVLMRQNDMAFKEISSIQGVGINTVLARMRYAVLALRKEFRDARCGIV